jgi:hypothetical protein
MKYRFFNWVYATIFGYFWLPCPVCGKNFGGHEWKDDNSVYTGKGDDGYPYQGTGVCPDCGEKAKRINLDNGYK